MTKLLEPSWENAMQALESVRDILLSSSQHAGIQRNWALARNLVDLAERADKLREDIGTVGSGKLLVEPLVPATPSAEQPQAHRNDADSYPRFFIRGGHMVKQGLQRNGVDQYEHAVPREQFSQILEHLREMAARRSKREFSVEQVHKALSALPKYMVYTTMSLLMHQGMLEKARKGAYKFARAESFADESSSLWNKLTLFS